MFLSDSLDSVCVYCILLCVRQRLRWFPDGFDHGHAALQVGHAQSKRWVAGVCDDLSVFRVSARYFSIPSHTQSLMRVGARSSPRLSPPPSVTDGAAEPE